MAEGIPEGVAAAAANPATSAENLRMIAYQYAPLRAVVAANPSAYPGLLEWLGQLGDPDVNQALARRAHRQPGTSTAPIPVVTPARQHPAPGTSPVAARGLGAPTAGSLFAPVSSQPVPQAQPQEKRSNSAVIIGVLLGVVVVLGVIAAFVIFGRSNTATPPEQPAPVAAAPSFEPSQSPDPTQDAAPSQSATPSASASPSQPEPEFPAPADATQASSIQSPSGNIRCTLAEGQVVCSLTQHDFTVGGSQDCGAGSPVAVAATNDAAGLACEQGQVGGGTVINYGASAAFGNVACTSYENGMSCWNTETGRGFAVARQGWQTGTDGRIEPGEFRF